MDNPSRFNELIHFDTAGLIPVVAQDAESGEVLLLAYMNQLALGRTIQDGVLVFWSRSRGRIWRKGEQSGNTLNLVELRLNCEGNSLLARVRPEGPGACHEGYRSCYFRRLEASPDGFQATIDRERVFLPEAVYGPARTLEQRARELYRLYEQLRDNNLVPDSATSRLLHREDAPAVCVTALARASEEVEELRGVVAGRHRHQGGKEDVVLEAGQAGYWVTVAAIARRIAFDDWRPDTAWVSGYRDGGIVEPLLPLRGTEDCEDQARIVADFRSLLMEAGRLCRLAGVDPVEAIAADLDSMRKRHSFAKTVTD